MAADTHAWFVTGTDTEIGKTLVASALTHACAAHGLRVAAMKPIAAGAVMRNGEMHNDDVAALAAADSAGLPRAWTTPYLLREPAAPHIAAALESVQISRMHLLDCYHRVTEAADAVVVEGVGGFRVPLSDGFDTADLAQMLGLPVVLVVGMRLGCISHALLTAEAIAARGLTLAGWVANELDVAMPHLDANIAALTARLPAPFLGRVPWLTHLGAASAAEYLDFSCLPGWPVPSAGAF
jgi:dethiobiotin synthetase